MQAKRLINKLFIVGKLAQGQNNMTKQRFSNDCAVGLTSAERERVQNKHGELVHETKSDALIYNARMRPWRV